MKKTGATGIERGQAITFRLPSDTPDHILRQLQTLKDTERRNFSSKIAEFVLEGTSNSLAKDRETITIPLPKQLTKEQRNWIKHSHSEALLGSIVYQLLADPVRATTILASLNSGSLNIDEALYLQEKAEVPTEEEPAEQVLVEETSLEEQQEVSTDEDLMNVDWTQVMQEQAATKEEEPEEEDVDDLLGDFLSKMNR